jgi:hypothetical protein
MTPRATDVLSLAFDVAAGRATAGEALPADLLAFATKVVALGRLVASTPRCPAAAIRRAEDLFRAPTARVRTILWRLVFDSWAGVAPALRGAGRPRFVRLAGENGSLHVELTRAADGSTRLRGTLDGPRADTALDVTPEGGRAVRIAVESGGTFDATVPVGPRSLVLAVRVGRRTVARTEPVPIGTE